MAGQTITFGSEGKDNDVYIYDATGKVYNVSGLSNSMTEKYVKELVNYKE